MRATAASNDLYKLRPGQRLIACGQTGSGKSTLARRYLSGSPYHWVIFNPKGTHAFDRLPDHTTLERKITPAIVDREINRHKYVDLKFPAGWTWQYQDALLRHLCEQYTNIGFLVDELYYLHASNGHAGTGLTGLLSRGRELRQSFIGLCQKPAFVSKFCFTEADYIVEFKLIWPDDRKKLYEYTGNREALVKREGHDFVVFDLVSDKAVAYRAA